MDLAGNLELNIGAQRVRGKILSRKELRCDSLPSRIAMTGTIISEREPGAKEFRLEIYGALLKWENAFVAQPGLEWET